MSQIEEREGGLVVNKWLAGIFATVIATGAVLFFVSYQESQTQAAVFEVQLASIRRALDEIKDDFAAMRGNLGDRWTRTQQHAYATGAKSDRDLLREQLQRHQALPWHREAGAEHAETKRRVDRIEGAIEQIRQDLREIEKQLKTR